MEHSCYQCHAIVEDGVPFCPHCNAPQIRVAALEEVPHAAIPGQPESGPPTSVLSTSVRWSQALPSTALAGLLAALVMVIPFGAFGLGILAAGALSVVFYRRRNPGVDLTPGMGARLGAMSGVLGFGMFVALISVEMALFRSVGEFRTALFDAIQQSASRSSDPQAQQWLEYFKSPPGLALMLALALGVMFVIFVALASAGGAAGAVLLTRKERL